MNSVKLEDSKLYITSEYYSMYRGRYMDTTVVDVSDISYIKAEVGVRGGMHAWSVKSKDDDRTLYSGDRKDSEIIQEIMKLLPKVKYLEKVEGGGAPW